ncbi:homoserine kinase [Actinopolymorpha alba]|uniref:homoserine kinase n=1 Tax=Actinopolymorpha alba TaxID=533267 RepID=UPI00036FB89B|nr:homoserine kinase [Actinopolymorpha alba]
MGGPSFRTDMVRVKVPATSANLGPGFDAFGLALALYDEVEVRVAPAGLAVDVTGEGAENVSRDDNNLVVRALRATLDRLGGQPSGLEVSCTNRIPHGRGLGSSAAAIAAGVLAGRALVEGSERVLDDTATLVLASELEGHPDNVAACLLGGLTVAWTDRGPGGVHAVRLEPAQVLPVAFVPSTPLSTEAARGLLPPTVPHADAAMNAGRAGLLVAVLAGAVGTTPAGEVDLDLLLAATFDRLHQEYRMPAMPASVALVDDLRSHGIPAVVSGAGPTVLAFTQESGAGEVVGRTPDGFVARVLPIDRTGASEMVGDVGNDERPRDVGEG